MPSAISGKWVVITPPGEPTGGEEEGQAKAEIMSSVWAIECRRLLDILSVDRPGSREGQR